MIGVLTKRVFSVFEWKNIPNADTKCKIWSKEDIIIFSTYEI